MAHENRLLSLPELEEYLKERVNTSIGYPVNQDNIFPELVPFTDISLNNVGDPFIESNYHVSTRPYEQAVIHFFAELYKMPIKDAWGYVTAGGTEGNLYGIFVGRELYPKGILYYSRDTHYSLSKIARLLRVPCEVIPSLENGEINYGLLEQALKKNSNYPAIMSLNVGTTMKGAVDNVDRIVSLCAEQNKEDYYIHADAALFGMLNPFLNGARQVNFEHHIDSIAISGHKFLGIPMPCGIVLAKKDYVEKIKQTVEYIGNVDTTVLGSRSGHAPLYLYQAIQKHGLEGFEQQANVCIQNAQYLYKCLQDVQYPASLNQYSNIVMFKRPTDNIVQKWQLACSGEWAHVVVMQHVTKAKIDAFLQELFLQ